MSAFDPLCLSLYEAGAALIDDNPQADRAALVDLYDVLEQATLAGDGGAALAALTQMQAVAAVPATVAAWERLAA